MASGWSGPKGRASSIVGHPPKNPHFKVKGRRFQGEEVGRLLRVTN